jgi:site-specific recombinase XerD
MFEQLFTCPCALIRQRDGPLAEERRRYLLHCAQQQMASRTLGDIARYTLLAAKRLRLAGRPGERITRAEVEAAADGWVNRRPNSPPLPRVRHAWLRFTRHATRWLSFLGRLATPDIAPQPYADLLAHFAAYMLHERGLSPQTIEHRRRIIQEFLTSIVARDLRLDLITVTHVDELLTGKVQDGGYARVTIRTYASTLRNFFRYAEQQGWCRPGLAAAVMAPRVYPHEVLLIGPSWDDVKRLLASTQGDWPAEIRDRALLLLLAVYGLRAGEVVGLRLQDFEWEREMLTVSRGKQRTVRTYPLCRPVGEAVLRYLREVRPRSAHREVFLTLRAPFVPLQRQNLGKIVSPRLHALGLTLPHYGPHALRHACATHLLACGFSFKEIGDHLGHQSPETTRLYAKVDRTGLQAVGEFDLEGLL